ncbi:MAG TPA: plasmid maintenance system killer [Candidatus Hydrogenedentes bacterium]|nr:plasmid maintenance system killer [Candidatus Hydrogenedentota bacterium]
MQLEFRTAALRRQYEESAAAARAYGAQVARKYIQRINILKAARNKGDITAQRPLRCHALKGERKGQHAILLHDRWRLIVTFTRDTVEVVRIEEVTQHYGD